MLNKIFLTISLIWGVAYAGDPQLIDLPQDHCRDAWKSIINKGKHNFKVTGSQSVDTNGVNQEYKKYLDDLNRHDCHKDWTILVYMQADNDLRPYAFWDLVEMESAFSGRRANGSTLKMDVLVHLDSDQDRKLRRFHMFQSQNKITNQGADHYKGYTVKDISSPITHEFDEDIESQKPQKQTFQEFIEWGMAQYPSKHYMVVVWGHGQGWSSSPAVQFGGVATDYSDNQRISVTEIRESLESIRNFSVTGEKVDVLAADACLMQTVEVASELGNEAKYVIGSTQIQNFMGLPYRRIFYEINTGDWQGLGKNPNYQDEPHRMAAMIPKVVASAFKPRNGGRGFHQGDFDPDGWTLFTMSSVNAEELNNQSFGVFEKLGEGILESLDQDFFLSTDLMFMVQNTESFLGGSRDITFFMSRLEEFYRARADRFEPKTLKKIADGIQGVRRLINETVIEYYYGEEYWAKNNNFYLGQFKAFGTWLPTDADNLRLAAPRLRKSYFVQQFSKGSWLTWMERLYSGGML
jgi:hypothetical protein